MPKLILATLYTDIVEQRSLTSPTEGGQFTMPVEIDTDRMKREPSPRQFFFREIGVHLAQAIADTTVPHEYWWIEFSLESRQWFNLPERQKLKL